MLQFMARIVTVTGAAPKTVHEMRTVPTKSLLRRHHTTISTHVFARNTRSNSSMKTRHKSSLLPVEPLTSQHTSAKSTKHPCISDVSNLPAKAPPVAVINLVGFDDGKQKIKENREPYKHLPPLNGKSWAMLKNPAMSGGLVVSNHYNNSMPGCNMNRLVVRDRTLLPSHYINRQNSNFNLQSDVRKRHLSGSKEETPGALFQITNSRTNTNNEALSKLTKRLHIALPHFYKNSPFTNTIEIDKHIPAETPNKIPENKEPTSMYAPESRMAQTFVVDQLNDLKEDTDVQFEKTNTEHLTKNEPIINSSKPNAIKLKQHGGLTKADKQLKNNVPSPVLHTSNDRLGCLVYPDLNNSFAYDDVKKYIEENDLMPPDKQCWMDAWLQDVNDAIFDKKPSTFRLNNCPLNS